MTLEIQFFFKRTSENRVLWGRVQLNEGRGKKRKKKDWNKTLQNVAQQVENPKEQVLEKHIVTMTEEPVMQGWGAPQHKDKKALAIIPESGQKCHEPAEWEPSYRDLQKFNKIDRNSSRGTLMKA